MSCVLRGIERGVRKLGLGGRRNLGLSIFWVRGSSEFRVINFLGYFGTSKRTFWKKKYGPEKFHMKKWGCGPNLGYGLDI